MAVTIRNQIILNIQNRLEDIQAAGGYYTNIGLDVYLATKHINADALYYCVLWPGAETAQKGHGFVDVAMSMKIEGVLRASPEYIARDSEIILGDLISCVCNPDEISTITGGLADRIDYVRGGLDEYPDAKEAMAVGMIQIMVHYRFDAGDPYSQTSI